MAAVVSVIIPSMGVLDGRACVAAREDANATQSRNVTPYHAAPSLC